MRAACAPGDFLWAAGLVPYDCDRTAAKPAERVVVLAMSGQLGIPRTAAWVWYSGPRSIFGLDAVFVRCASGTSPAREAFDYAANFKRWASARGPAVIPWTWLGPPASLRPRRRRPALRHRARPAAVRGGVAVRDPRRGGGGVRPAGAPARAGGAAGLLERPHPGRRGRRRRSLGRLRRAVRRRAPAGLHPRPARAAPRGPEPGGGRHGRQADPRGDLPRQRRRLAGER